MHGMTYIGRFFSNFKDFYNDINAATLTGAIDVVVVEQPDGTFNCSPFHVRFGKLGVLRSREKVVDIEINGEPQDIHMKLGESGEAFFVEELEGSDENEIPEHLATSPIPVSEFEKLYNSPSRRRNSIDLGENNSKPVLENEVNDYTKRRYTADNESDKNRERDFLKRQIGLGNIDIGENSTEDISLSLQSNTKISSEDVSKDNDISDTIFKMDSLEIENSRSEKLEVAIDAVKSPAKGDEPSSESKSSKKRRRKKSMMKKKNAQRKSASNSTADLQGGDGSDQNDLKTSDSATDRSSLDSNISDPELKEMQKLDMEASTSTSSNRKKATLDPDFHFFSDTELTTNNIDSRPNSPIHIESVQSDTEFEVKNRKDEVDEEEDKGHRWGWGEFPSVSQTNSPTSENVGVTSQEQEHNSMLTSMFSFMKQNKHRRHNSTDGVYLADITSGAINAEVAALYFSNTEKKKNADADMDCESGNGPSLTQSPNSVEGSKSIDSDFDEQNKSAQTYMHDISLSLCGWNPEPTEDSFIRHVVAFSDLCNNPSLLESPNLVVRIKTKYYNWKVAAPIISSLVIYQRPLPQSTIDQLCSLHMPTVNIQDKETKQEGRSYWWYWRRNRTSREVTPALDNVPGNSGKPTETETIKESTSIEVEQANIKVENANDYTLQVEQESIVESTSQERPNTPSKLSSSSSDKYRKTLRLSSKQIASLNLRDGMNEVEFSVTTAYQGTSRCKCHLYKWKWDDKIVISDIDGTITKSDVLGHILPIVGKDWAQSGVAQLFNKIKDNGYKLLYLSARAIGQARITREYLKSIKQGDLSMPDGPLLLNPTSLITAFHREVIEKKPEQFKISCMSDIRALFPPDANPFYAGYGNRINDVWAYRAVGIPIVRIFTINPKGELKHELTQTFQSSYSNMSYIVDQLFPPLLEAANDYSQFVYWREPVAAIEELPDIS